MLEILGRLLGGRVPIRSRPCITQRCSMDDAPVLTSHHPNPELDSSACFVKLDIIVLGTQVLGEKAEVDEVRQPR